MGTKFSELDDAVTVQDTDLFALSRSPHTAGSSLKAASTYLVTYLTGKLQKTTINQPVATLAALKALSTTGVGSGVSVYCIALYGLYIFHPGVASIGNDFQTVSSTDGGGQWFRVDPNVYIQSLISTNTTLPYLPAVVIVSPTAGDSTLTLPALTYANGAFPYMLFTVINQGTKTMLLNYSDNTPVSGFGVEAGLTAVYAVSAPATPGLLIPISKDGPGATKFPVTEDGVTYNMEYPLSKRYVFAPNAGVGLGVVLPQFDASKVKIGQTLEILNQGGTNCSVQVYNYSDGIPITNSSIGPGGSLLCTIGVNDLSIVRLGTASDHEASEFQAAAQRDSSNGYAGLTLLKINFKNVLGTFISFFTNTNTAARTYTFQDRNGTIADDTDLALKQSTSAKDTSGGYAGLTLLAINFKNAANTFTSFLANLNTASRYYTFQDRDGTIADDTDLGLKQSTSAKDASGGYAGLTLFKINFKNVANSFTSFFTNSNTAARTYTFQDRNGTMADDTDLGLKLTKTSNLSDLADAPTARTNLGLGTAATLASTAVLQAANNLSEVASAPTSIANLGLGVINNQTGATYTILAADKGKVIYCSNAGAITVTMPNLGVNFFCKIIQKGAGNVTVVGGSGMTPFSANSALKTRTTGSDMNISQDTTSTFNVNGDLTQ